MAPSIRTPQTPATLLVVDDDPIALGTLKALLEASGFQVLEARDGAQAVQRVRDEHLRPISAILDFNMPGMDGLQTFAALRQLLPGLKAILCSGNSEWECLHGQPLEDLIYLRKTFKSKALGAALRRVLAE